MTKRFTTEEYVAICREVHNNFYRYPNTAYKHQKARVEVECPVHGPFEQIAGCHRAGKGCEKCASESRPRVKQENASRVFLEKVHAVPEHKDKNYIYEKVVYKGVRTKITVTCLDHGDFDITPNNFLNGKGCVRCAKNGYRPNKPGTLYILTDSQGTTKVGITNREVRFRERSISKTSGRSFTALHTYNFEDGAIPRAIELSILAELRQQYKQPDEKFDGSTECFLNVDQAALLTSINQLIQEHSDAHNKQ